MRNKFYLVTLLSAISLVSCLELKCTHVKDNVIYHESEQFCKNRDLAKHGSTISENSSMNLLCSLTLSLLNEDTCKHIDSNVIDLKTIESKPLCDRFSNILSSTAITSDYSDFLIRFKNTNLCTKICIDFDGKVQSICKLLLSVLLNVKQLNVTKELNTTKNRNIIGDSGFDFGDIKKESKHDTIVSEIHENNLRIGLRKLEKQSDLVILFGLTVVVILGYLIYFNKQKIMGYLVEGPNSRPSNNRKYNYRKLKVNLEDTISSNDNSYDKESSFTAVIY